jgi:hypothetical protein
VIVAVGQPTPLDKKLRLDIEFNPETLALAYDWEDIATKVVRTQEKIKECVMHFILVSPFDLGLAGFHRLNQIPKLWEWFIYTIVRPFSLFHVYEYTHMCHRDSPHVRHDSRFLFLLPGKRIFLAMS